MKSVEQPVIKVKQVPKRLAGLRSFNLDQDAGLIFIAQLMKFIHRMNTVQPVPACILIINVYSSNVRFSYKSVILNEHLNNKYCKNKTFSLNRPRL